METKTIGEYYQEYENILNSGKTETEKDAALAALMTEMEYQYQIPVLMNEKWERDNDGVSSLYKTIIDGRRSIFGSR